MTHDVPQGSNLGSHVFVIYMNNFSKLLKLLFAVLYADDTSIFLEGTRYNKIILEWNTELLKLNHG